MKQIIADDYEALSAQSAKLVIEYIQQKPTSVLVFPTGNTPLGMFAELVSAFHRKEISFKNCYLIELDDYFNIPLSDYRNLYNWLDAEFISQVDIPAKNIVRFNTASAEPEQECARVEDVIKNFGGIDLLVLGLGPNGHLGFNEPGSDFESITRVITLSTASIKSSAQYWGKEEEVPPQGITLGLKTLSSARHTLLLVSGREKAQIFEATFQKPSTTYLPATILRQFKNLTVVVDKAAINLSFG